MAELYWAGNVLHCKGRPQRGVRGVLDSAIGEVTMRWRNIGVPESVQRYVCRFDGSFCQISMPCETAYYVTLEEAKDAMYATALLVIVAPEGTYDVD